MIIFDVSMGEVGIEEITIASNGGWIGQIVIFTEGAGIGGEYSELNGERDLGRGRKLSLGEPPVTLGGRAGSVGAYSDSGGDLDFNDGPELKVDVEDAGEGGAGGIRRG
jgi:hypothetical protein